MEVPGSLGYGILGDKSLEFVKSPREYLQRQIKNHGDVFKGRILNKAQVFVTSNSAVEDLLLNKSSHFSMVYKYYLHALFDEVLVFLEGEEWEEARRVLETAFTQQAVFNLLDRSRSLIRHHFRQMKINEPVEVYNFFKEVFTRLSIALFLSEDMDDTAVEEISSLMTTHWRGIISVPLPIRVPFFGWRSGYSKALEAKEKLLRVILEKLQTNSSSNVAAEVGEAYSNKVLAAQHLLLFVSALIPKAMASLLTSAVIELSKGENLGGQDRVQDGAVAEHVMLEVQRLWPPFFGGARICTESCEVAGFRIDKGTNVSYISYSANRDHRVFSNPDTFLPERWANENAGDKDRVWTFGGGVRKCIGKFLTNTLLKECLQELALLYRWELVPGQDLDYKTLPISRPKCDIQAIFTPRRTS